MEDKNLVVLPPSSLGAKIPWRWRHYGPSKCRYLLTTRRGVTSQTSIFSI